MKKFISMVLIITMLCLNLSVTIFAEENKILTKFKVYNNKKISLFMSVVELYQFDWGLDINTNKDVYTEEGRKFEIEDETGYSNTKNKLSWLAYHEDKLLTEDQLYTLLGLDEETKKAFKSNKKSKGLYYGGIFALGIGVLMLSSSQLNSSDTTEGEADMLGALLAAGGAFAMMIGNKTTAEKNIDYIDMFKLVEKHNVDLLDSYFEDLNIKNQFKEIDRIKDLKDLCQYKYKDLGEIKEEHSNKKFNQIQLSKGMTKEKVLQVCGYPYLTDSYKSFTSWKYIVLHENNKMFDLGKFVGESYNNTIYTLYFNNDKLIDWTEQNYTLE